MRLRSPLLLIALLYLGCASSSQNTGTQPAIRVAGLNARGGPASERAYLDQLRGPNGETVTYERQGSCCAFETPNGILNQGMLDMYEVSYDGLPKPLVLYLNMYDPPEGALKAPEGFVLSQ